LAYRKIKRCLADNSESDRSDYYRYKKSGRQEYLNQDHTNFSRVWHDYSDPKKGFITWKGLLEERLI
jgi:hypothetical protein